MDRVNTPALLKLRDILKERLKMQGQVRTGIVLSNDVAHQLLSLLCDEVIRRKQEEEKLNGS